MIILTCHIMPNKTSTITNATCIIPVLNQLKHCYMSVNNSVNIFNHNLLIHDKKPNFFLDIDDNKGIIIYHAKNECYKIYAS